MAPVVDRLMYYLFTTQSVLAFTPRSQGPSWERKIARLCLAGGVMTNKQGPSRLALTLEADMIRTVLQNPEGSFAALRMTERASALSRSSRHLHTVQNP